MSEAVRTHLQADSGGAKEFAREDAGFLWNFWYPAVRGSAIRGTKLVTAMLLEVPLVLGRTCGGQSVRYAGFLSAPGDSAFLWAL